jgi:ABC-type lipoprotein release transport system permease subunit
VVVRCLRASVRRRAASIAVVALVPALLFGAALCAFGGARRSSSAIDRLLEVSAPEDLYVSPPENGGLDMDAVERLPQVRGAAYQSYLAMVPVSADGRPQIDLAGSINPYLYTPAGGPPDAINHLRIIEGRDLDPGAPLEVVIDEELAADRHLAVGSHLRMATYSAEQLETVFGNETSGADTPAPEGPVLDLSVVGLARMPVDIHPGEEDHTTASGGTKDIYLTPALYRRFGRRIAIFGPPIQGMAEAIVLVHGVADLDAFVEGVRALPGGRAAVIDVSDSDAFDSARTARRAIGVETAALAGLGVLLAVSGIVLMGHALARLARASAGDLGVLRAIGLRPVQVLTVTAMPGVIAMALGSIGAGFVALAASPFTPIGLARQAEVSPGFEVDPTVLLGGAAAALLVGLALAVLSAWPTARSAGAERQISRSKGLALPDRLASAGAPFSPTIGARFVLGRRGVEPAAPLRSAMVAGAAAIVVLIGVSTFDASLARLSRDPADQGAGWDLAIGNINLSDYTTEDIARLVADPHVAGVAAAAAPQGRGTVNGLDVTLAGLDVVEAGAGPRILTGRLPTSLGEVALGRRTAARLRLHLGDRVTVRAGVGSTRRATFVGTALLNPGIAPTMQIGEGALVSIEQIRALDHDQPVTFLLASVKPGASLDGTIRALARDWGHNVARPVNAPDVVNLRRVRGIPVALALTLAATAAVLLAFALVLSVRERRVDISILRAIGATRRQLASALTWQALWLYGAAALAAVPLGVIAGRLVWKRIADDLGVVVTPVVPLAQVALIVLAGLALVLALVALPARAATRLRPGRALRTA